MNLERITSSVLTDLPLEQRATVILRAIAAGWTRDDGSFSNRRNVLLTLNQHHGVGILRNEAQGYEEAVDYLRAQGFIARESSQNGDDWFYVTSRGWDLVESDDASPADLEATRRLVESLHPRIANKVKTQLQSGETELAVFAAMRQVEIRVAELSGLDLTSTKLMRAAFAKDGPLADPEIDPGERDSTMALFWGAIGVFKNPSSHREVDFEVPEIAENAIRLADMLLRLLDSMEKER